MNEIQLKYGCNPNQKPSRIYMEDGSDLPVKVLNGKPGARQNEYIYSYKGYTGPCRIHT